MNWSPELYKSVESVLFAHFVRLDILYGDRDDEGSDYFHPTSYGRGAKSRRELYNFYQAFTLSAEIYHGKIKFDQFEAVLLLLQMAKEVYLLEIEEEFPEKGIKRKRLENL